MIEWGAILTVFILMVVGQLIHQVVKIKRAHRKFNSHFRVKEYIRQNHFVFFTNMFLIGLLAIANFFVPILTGNIAYLLAGFAVDKTILSVFGNGHGIKKKI